MKKEGTTSTSNYEFRFQSNPSPSRKLLIGTNIKRESMNRKSNEPYAMQRKKRGDATPIIGVEVNVRI